MAEKNSKGIFDLSSVYDRQVAGYAPVTLTFIPENLNRNTVLQIQGKNALDGNNKTFLDSSGNVLALTPTGTPTQGSFSPFSPAGWFAGGGGGGGLLATAESGGPGGLGGGGYGGNVYGSQTTAYGYNGNAYTGGGGGGTSDVHSIYDGGLGAQGGSGIVIVSYAGTSALATGGTISTTARPGYVCHTFTGIGTFAVT